MLHTSVHIILQRFSTRLHLQGTGMTEKFIEEGCRCNFDVLQNDFRSWRPLDSKNTPVKVDSGPR